MTQSDNQTVYLEAECVSCGHKWTMTNTQIKEAERFSCATCPECLSPATVEEAKTT